MTIVNEKQFQGQLAAATRKLEQFPPRVIKRTLRKAATEANKHNRSEARSLAPRLNGYLRRSLIGKVKTYQSGVVGLVGQDLAKLRRGGTKARAKSRGGGISGRGETVPSHLVENPTKAHTITPEGQSLRWDAGGRGRGRRFAHAARVRHRGTRGVRFIHRAAARTTRSSRRTFERRLIEESLKL